MSEKLPIEFDANGLVTVVVQDHLTGEVRMVAYATVEAVTTTLDTGRATFWSRSRGELWEKGRTSGNAIAVRRVLVDCDADCLVYEAEPLGPSCHTGAPSCFFQALEKDDGRFRLVQRAERPQTVLARLEEVLEARKESTADTSYTKRLYEGGAPAIGAKIREEANELAAALAGETDARVVAEAADVVYHVIVGLQHRGIAWRDVLSVLEARSVESGLEEKARRSRQV